MDKEIEIKKGNIFICILDYVMDDKTIAFKAGLKYKSERDGCLNSEICKNHIMGAEPDFDLEPDFDFYFKKERAEISEEKEVIFKLTELQFRRIGGDWTDYENDGDYEYRLKPTVLKEKQSIEVDDEIIDVSDNYEYLHPLDKKWYNLTMMEKIRKKPKPDFSKEINALNEKAKEAGMKAVISFEKL